MIAAITYDPPRQNKYRWINLATELCMFYGKEQEDGLCLCRALLTCRLSTKAERLHVEQLGKLHETFHFICFPPLKDMKQHSAINKYGLWSMIWNLSC